MSPQFLTNLAHLFSSPIPSAGEVEDKSPDSGDLKEESRYQGCSLCSKIYDCRYRFKHYMPPSPINLPIGSQVDS